MFSGINVVFTIDENYIQHFTVALTSLLDNNKCIDRVFLVSELTDNADLDISLKYFKEKYHKNIELKYLNGNVCDSLKISHHITKATYFRLLLADILPNDINEVLFLDSDILVIGDISEIADLDFCHSNNSVLKNDELYIYAASHNYNKDDMQRLRKIGYASDDYFNAGVMYINLMRWREEKISERLMHIANKYKDDLLFWDQDVLNIAFQDSWEKLDFSFNAFNLEVKTTTDQYKIIHYTGSSKPWHFVNKHPYKKEYFNCLKLTPFSNYKPNDITLKNAVIRFLIPAKVFKFIKSRK